MIKQTSVLGVFLVLRPCRPNALGSKEWKAMKNCRGKATKSLAKKLKRKLLQCPVLPSTARGEAGPMAGPESSRQAEQVSEIWEGRRKAGTEIKHN